MTAKQTTKTKPAKVKAKTKPSSKKKAAPKSAVKVPVESQDRFLAKTGGGKISHHVFPKGTMLFDRGEERHCAYLVDYGQIEIYGNDEDDDGPDKLLCTLGPGEIFGEMALIDNAPRSARAITASEAEIFVVPRQALQSRVESLDPIISLLISLLIERYRFTRINLPESIKQNEADELIKKIGGTPSTAKSDGVMRLHDMNEQKANALKEIKLEQELRTGLENDQFYPVLQPILSLPDQKIAGFEALIRWQHPDKGLVSPVEFIPVAERTGMVQQLDKLMLEKACDVTTDMNEILYEETGKLDNPLFISVNLSGINFETLDIVDTVRKSLIRTGIDPNWLKLEITESALIDDPDHAEKVLKGLKILGLKVALDDFGTGYSSLGYLHRFPIDLLKIDRSFIAQIHDGHKSMDIVRAIIGLAKNFKFEVVAEGIEQEQDIVALNSLACDLGQGFYFGRPMSIEDAGQFIRDNLKNKTKK